jgi:hypothetical protein
MIQLLYDNDNWSLTSAPTIGDSVDGNNHPRKWGSRSLTTLNQHLCRMKKKKKMKEKEEEEGKIR